MSKCNCFEDNLKRMEEHILKELPEHTDFDIGWDGYGFFFNSDQVPVNPKINYEYRAFKKDGSPMKNLSKASVSMLSNYCPYCGRKLGDSSGE